MRTDKVIFEGKGISLNEWYSGKGGWRARHTKVNKYKGAFSALMLEAGMHLKPKYQKATVRLDYNSRLDPDNAIAMVKIFIDCFKVHYIKEDDKRYIRGVMIHPDETLDKNTYVFTVEEA